MAADTSGAMDRPPESHLEDGPQRPVTEITTQVSGGRFIPTFSEPEHWEGGSFGEHADVAKATGLHPEYVDRLMKNLPVTGPDIHVGRARTARTARMDGPNQVPTTQGDMGSRYSPPTLFIQSPKRVTVDRMFSDPSMPTGTALSLAAMAMRDHHVEELIPSEDLSEHSSKLVQHAKKLGVIKDNKYNAEAEPTNDIKKQSHTVDANSGWGKDTYGEEGRGIGATLHKASERDVFGAQQAVRKIIRGRSSKGSPKISSQFDTPLPGMEGFV
jgi:hypothetical protein